MKLLVKIEARLNSESFHFLKTYTNIKEKKFPIFFKVKTFNLF